MCALSYSRSLGFLPAPAHLSGHPLLVSGVDLPNTVALVMIQSHPSSRLFHPSGRAKTNRPGERLAQTTHDIRWSAHRGDHLHRHCVYNSPARRSRRGSALAIAGKNYQIKGITLDGDGNHCTTAKKRFIARLGTCCCC